MSAFSERGIRCVAVEESDNMRYSFAIVMQIVSWY